ncbi:MAG: hypothetical protein AAF672_01775 [Pseudomonadota bacterium]
MVGDNKILTVSYGTFSCTLEGFDDPFSTMKAIAEYFRDLAAEDRFFGAEPPQPDADMLHRIAEQTVQSRVAAEVSDNSLVLRQDHSASPVSAATPIAAAMPQPTPDVASTPMVDPAAMQGDSIAAKLQRIRSVVAQEAQTRAAEEQLYSEDQHADGFDTKAKSTPIAVADVTTPSPSFADDGVETPDVDAAETIEASDDVTSAISENVEGDAIEASQPAEETAAEDVAETEMVADIETARDTEEGAGVLAEETAEEIDEDTLAGALDALDEDEDQVSDSAENIFEEAAPRRRVVVQKITREDVEAAQSGEAEPSDNEDLSEEAEAALMRELADVEADIEEATAPEVEEDSAELSAVETLQAVLEDQPAEEAEITDETATEPVVENTSADVEDAELSSDESETEKEDARAERKARRSLLLETEDAALNRLMDATRSKMSDDDEGAVRRASIAHLKAAVAATKADGSIAEAAAQEEERELDQYRDDLARVVRPVRSRAVDPDTDEARPSTLMLVSEQRIEKSAEDASASPDAEIRPRRVATSGNLALEEDFEDADANAISDGIPGSFNDYAQRYNALELPDLLEAAAAHYTYVEGTKEFTRPMLMRKISTLSSGSIPSREDGLRCFGALLRDNKIIRSGNGKFVLADDTRFASEAQSAAS